MAKHMKIDLTDQGFDCDQIDSNTCPVCGGHISYRPEGFDDWLWDESYVIFYTTCPSCKSKLSASYDFHDTQVDKDGRFDKEY